MTSCGHMPVSALTTCFLPTGAGAREGSFCRRPSRRLLAAGLGPLTKRLPLPSPLPAASRRAVGSPSPPLPVTGTLRWLPWAGNQDGSYRPTPPAEALLPHGGRGDAASGPLFFLDVSMQKMPPAPISNTQGL